MKRAQGNKKSFEDLLKELEIAVEKLESGDLNLEDSLNTFKEGILLVSDCNQKLDDAEKKISVLIEQSSGGFKEEKFEHTGE